MSSSSWLREEEERLYRELKQIAMELKFAEGEAKEILFQTATIVYRKARDNAHRAGTEPLSKTKELFSQILKQREKGVMDEEEESEEGEKKEGDDQLLTPDDEKKERVTKEEGKDREREKEKEKEEKEKKKEEERRREKRKEKGIGEAQGLPGGRPSSGEGPFSPRREKEEKLLCLLLDEWPLVAKEVFEMAPIYYPLLLFSRPESVDLRKRSIKIRIGRPLLLEEEWEDPILDIMTSPGFRAKVEKALQRRVGEEKEFQVEFVL